MTASFIQGRSVVADALITQIKNLKTPYVKEVSGLAIEVHEGVYPPEKKEILISYLENPNCNLLQNHPNVLEYGCGSGFLAIYAALKGAMVTAIDINTRAVKCTIENVKRHHLENKVTTLQSDGFSNIPSHSKFDFIIASLPWEAAEVDNHHDIDIAFYDPHFKMRRALFEKGYDFLSPTGCILLTYSKRADKINPLSTFSHKFHFEIVHKAPSTDGNEEEYLYKATKI